MTSAPGPSGRRMFVNSWGRVKAGLRCQQQFARTDDSGQLALDGSDSWLQESRPKSRGRRFGMADEDFDTDRLAAYLHLMPAEVVKLAERGKLPGRRIGGAWKFSAAEVHHWMEERIGLSDHEELVDVEGALERIGGQSTNKEVSIAALLRPEAIAVPLVARTRTSVITRMAELAAGTHLLWDAEGMADAVRAREAMHSTALDNGVAMLHPRRPMASILAEAVIALGLTPGGIPFGNEGRLTDIFFLICSTSDHEHLRILARLSRVINDADLLAELRAANDAATVHQLIAARDAVIQGS